FLQELDPRSSGAYVLAGAFRLRGPLDEPALQRALESLVARHETLRTGLVAVDGEPVQVIEPQVAVGYRRADLSREEDRPAALDRWLAEEIHRPFDLSRP